MKIAFVDNLRVGGGLSRFSYMLSKKMLEYDTNLHIDYFVHAGNLENTPELKTLNSRFEIKVLNSTIKQTNNFKNSIVKRILRKFKLIKKVNYDTIKEIEERVKDYDVAFFPVAHMMRKPNLDIPMVGTIHDFNWKYFFGSEIFPLSFVKEMDVEILNWLNTTVTTCSSKFVVSELKKLYPGIEKLPEVIHLAPLIFSEKTSYETEAKVLADLKINFPYIIFPGNFFPHKNHSHLFSAFSLLTKQNKYSNLKLILTGLDSNKIPYGIAERYGVQILTQNSQMENFNIIGLGYQPNYILEILIKKAELLVSPSIYEAICTPGMDAWYLGTPTAISNIEPFEEHEEIWGIKTAYFDPLNIQNIAEVIDGCLSNYSETKLNAEISKEKISTYTWDNVALKYLNVLKRAINDGKIE